ncbi:MAG: hypothetical protein Q9221_008829 [Calogaya cf. arnoldii]
MTKGMSLDVKILRKESEEQRAQLGFFKNCRIETSAGKAGRGIRVEIFPGESEKSVAMEVKDFDFTKKVGEVYTLDAPRLFPVLDNTFQSHPIFGQSETSAWQIRVIKNNGDSEAPIVGLVMNWMEDNQLFLGKDHGVTLEPIFLDVLGDRVRDTIKTFKDVIDDYKADLQGFSSSTEKPHIPIHNLFSTDPCDKTKVSRDDDSDPKKLADLRKILNESQFKGSEMILREKVSIIWGPPGTGKSLTLAMSMLNIVDHTDEYTLACAVSHVAVDELYRKFKGRYRLAHGDDAEMPVTRTYTDGQIMAQYAAGDLDPAADPYHLESRRIKLAEKNPSMTDWLEVRRELQEYGSLDAKEKFNTYSKKGSFLTEMVLKNHTRVVFCTVATCQSRQLDRKDGEGNVTWAYPADDVFFDEAGTATRPWMLMPLMAFKKTLKRFILAGDPLQLPAFKLSDLAKKEWPKSLLHEIIKRNWPCTFLNTQYRMIQELYEHLVAVVYDGREMFHAKKMKDMSAEGKQLVGVNPCTSDEKSSCSDGCIWAPPSS